MIPLMRAVAIGRALDRQLDPVQKKSALKGADKFEIVIQNTKSHQRTKCGCFLVPFPVMSISQKTAASPVHGSKLSDRIWDRSASFTSADRFGVDDEKIG